MRFVCLVCVFLHQVSERGQRETDRCGNGKGNLNGSLIGAMWIVPID